jgi:uncharacterized repeat protein (TIGR01451 family)
VLFHLKARFDYNSSLPINQSPKEHTMQKVLPIIGLFLSILLLALLSLSASTTTGYTARNELLTNQAQIMPGTLLELRATDEDAFSFVARTNKSIRQSGSASQQANIEVTYHDFSSEARQAFQYAVDIWEGQLFSPVTIRVEAYWIEFSNPGVLGAAGPNYIHRNFPGAPQADTWYPDALADKLAASDQNPGGFDLSARFNSTRSDWYFGSDGNTPSGQYDFVSVVLHELGHGLGFGGSASVSNGVGNIGSGNPRMPRIYDRYVENGGGQAILNFSNGSTALASQLQSNNLYFNGSAAIAANGGSRPKLYLPSNWQQGSSYSHLDENTFSAGDANSLMTPALSSAEGIHDPGDIVRGMFVDMGWSLEEPTPTATSTPTPTATPTNTPPPTPHLSLMLHNEPKRAVLPGDTITYTISYKNDGGSFLNGVVITGHIPLSTTYVMGSASGQVSATDDGVGWNIGALAQNGQGQRSYRVQVIEPTFNESQLEAPGRRLSQSESLVSATPNNSTANYPIAADEDLLALNKIASSESVLAGEPLTYTLFVTNTSVLTPTNATFVMLTDTLPLSVTLSSIITPTQGSCLEALATASVTCDFGTLESGQSISTTLIVMVDPAARGTLTNTVTVSAAEDEPILDNNTYFVVTAVYTATDLVDLAVSKAASSEMVLAGERLSYTLKVINTSSLTATNVYLTDTLPLSVTLSSIIAPTQGNCSPQQNQIACELGTLESKQSVSTTLVVIVDPAARGTLTNAVIVSTAEEETTLINNSDRVTTTIASQADLKLSKIAKRSWVQAGKPLTYTLSISNKGASDATFIMLTDTLPLSLIATSFTSKQGDCDTSTLSCQFNHLASGETLSATLRVMVDPAINPSIIANHASVSAMEHDPDKPNNQSKVKIAVVEPRLMINRASGYASQTGHTQSNAAINGAKELYLPLIRR